MYLSSAVWLFPLVDESFLLAGGVGIAAERNTTGKGRQCTHTVYGIGRHNCEHLHNKYSVNPQQNTKILLPPEPPRDDIDAHPLPLASYMYMYMYVHVCTCIYGAILVSYVPLSECVLVAFLMPGLVAPSLRLITDALMSSTVA